MIAEFLSGSDEPEKANVTIGVLALRYVEFAESYYVKDGKTTPENGQIRCALKPLVKRYRSLQVSKFGPLKLQKVREDMLSNTTWTRNTINDHIGRIVKMIKWGVSQEAVAPEVYAACRSVENLKKGRCQVYTPCLFCEPVPSRQPSSECATFHPNWSEEFPSRL